ncbi:receptor-like protein kinase HERK 1 [Curcuma longa]|uniref:receptor-like protein kinase HERK 1 n=1 Tax=Curcuma longa TaxID=136217 RepID=UPI003D9DFE06
MAAAAGIRILGLVFLVSSMASMKWCFCAFTPADRYLIDCGSPTSTTIGSRIFVADLSLSSTLTTPTNILANTTRSPGAASFASELYQTARIFTGPSSYSFPIRAQGRHFIRLYFFPFVYSSYDLTAATFNVSTQDLMLLHNFRSNSSAMKEFLVNTAHDTLILSFAPSGISSLAFVNAIEVVSAPDNLITDNAQTVRMQSYQGLSAQAFETIYHLNVGGQDVLPDGDVLWRTWDADLRFLMDATSSKTSNTSGRLNYLPIGATEESAPAIVYATARELVSTNTSNAKINMTWKLNVDAGFSYLMRFHFCDIVSLAANQLYFNVSVGNWHILTNFDLSSTLFRKLAAPYFVDFVIEASDAPDELSISITPSGFHVPHNGILNGLEILKMNFSVGSVMVVPPPSSSGSKKNTGIVVGSVIGSIAILVVFSITLFMVPRRRKLCSKQSVESLTTLSTNGLSFGRTTNQNSIETASLSETNGQFGYRFPFVVLEEATNNFDNSLMIGFGGFGKVYKGVLRDNMKIAVKRGNSVYKQGLKEFRNEIELLSQLRHHHLVCLVGFCDEKNEMILVYEYMANGTLKKHLYGSGLPPLTWTQRLEICIGAAKGLHYLHTSSSRAIIHRDVKSANILLDENLLAKVSDFGLSKTGPDLDHTHVTTAVKGSFGYLDPEYFRRQKLTEKSDVYSFGVVLLEVLCARPVINPTLPNEQVSLAEWGMQWLKKGELGQIVDSRIAGQIRPASLRKFGATIEHCLEDYGADRPTMADVLRNLEYALKLQESEASLTETNSESINPTGDVSSSPEFNGPVTNDYTDASIDKAFSQLMNSEAR